MEILRVENVIKKFGDYAASNDVSFKMRKGTVLGLLGPNGAGKTTLIRMITNIISPDSGTIYFNDKPVSSDIQNKIGYLPEERGLYKKLKVIEQLEYFGMLKGLNKHDASKSAKSWLARMGASGWENKKIQELSKGMQQKVQFISTVLHNPEFLILDEPFSGFDPINTELLKNIILEMKSNGTSLILSTHVMAQAEELCDDICMINKGKLVLNGNISHIKSSYGKNTVIIEFSGENNFLNDLEDIEILSKTNNRAEFKINEKSSDNRRLIEQINNAVELYKFELALPSLHEIFIEVVSKKETV